MGLVNTYLHLFFGLFWALFLVPKISGLINPLERQIAARVRRVRESAYLSQSEFAAALGETLNRVASIEYARTPLTVGVADKLSIKFNINLQWLKTGAGKMKPSLGTFALFLPEIKGFTLFSAANVDALDKRTDVLFKFNQHHVDIFAEGAIVLPKGKKQKELVRMFHEYFDDEFVRLPHKGREKLLALSMRTIAKFASDWMRGDEETPGENISLKLLASLAAEQSDLFKVEDEEFRLTHLTTAVTSGGVNQWNRLKARIQKATENPGGKSMLAKFLRVDLTQISRWLSKTGPEPGADYALKMLQWVQEQESQQ
jgi:transcriptional regulator with XRE-family HTH domain